LSELFLEEKWRIGGYFYPFYKHYLNVLAKNLNSCVILDAGCGPFSSSFIRIPSESFFVGVDISRSNLLKSTAKSNSEGRKDCHYVLSSIADLPFRTETFDVVVSCDVLEHVPEKKAAVSEAYRVCKPEAFFVGSTTNLMNPILFIDSYFGFLIKPLVLRFAGSHWYERHRRWSYAQLHKQLTQEGFNCNITVFGFPPFNASPYKYNTEKKVPIYAYLWIVLNKIEGYTPLRLLREILVFKASKLKNGKK
jgi:ubiquinone/menaquinone biosynthesis C-methylase UbiE